MTPTDTILALEKALEAGSLHAAIMNIAAPEKVKNELAGPPKGFYLLGHRDARHAAAELASEQDAAIRTLLDAHASALRDAARYRWLRDEAWSGEHSGKRLPHVVVFRPGLMPSAVLELAEDALDDAIDAARAALDDNTKGAAE